MVKRKLNKSDCWVVIPSYNEQKHIKTVVRKVKKQGFHNVVVVDDGSKDKTSSEGYAGGAFVLRQVINLHKGASMRTGAEFAIRKGAKAIIYLDGDGQHEPEELPHFLNELNAGKDIVFGARKEVKKMPFQRRLGKVLISNGVRFLFGMNVKDVLSGYRAFTTDVYEKILWSSSDYKVETEMVIRTGKAHLNYSEITISTIYHDRYKGVDPLNGIVILLHLFWWRIAK
jgi:glycosyltransferase involved in cell wall biosynthesis